MKQNTDSVVERHESALANARSQVAGAKVRRDRAVGSVVRADGSVRRGAAAEAAARNVEIEALAHAVTLTEAALAHAVADAPRRERESVKSRDLAAEADDLERAAQQLRDALQKSERDIASRRAKSAEHARLASHTAGELEARAAQEQAAAAKAQRERRMSERAAELTEASRVREVA